MMSSSCVPFMDPSSKGAEEVNSWAVCEAVKEVIHSMEVATEVDPMDPIAQVDFGSLIHDPVGTCSPRSKVKTSEISLMLGRSIFQEAFCWRGKSELNLVRNSVLSRA